MYKYIFENGKIFIILNASSFLTVDLPSPSPPAYVYTGTNPGGISDGDSTVMWARKQLAFSPACPLPSTHARCNYYLVGEDIVCSERRSGWLSSVSAPFRGTTTTFFGTSTTSTSARRRRRTRTGANTAHAPTAQLNLNDLENLQARASAFGARTRQFLQSQTGQLFVWGGLFWLLISGQIGWILQSFFFLLFMCSVVPVLGILVLRFWLNRQLVQGSCPSCGAPVTGLKGRSFQCMSCGTWIQNDGGGPDNFSVGDPSTATIDIDAKRID